MQALVLEDSLRLGQLPRPEPSSTEALVRVHCCAISRADLDMISGRRSVEVRPVILGHQFVGTVDAVVDPALERWVGRRVAARTHNGCGRCLACRQRRTWLCETGRAHGVGFGLIDGAFAEYVNVPSAALVEVPEGIDDDEATFIHPLAIALRAVEQVEGPAPQRVLVVGDGNMGLLVTFLLHAAGHAVTVFGRHPSRRDLLWHSGIGFTGISEEDEASFDELDSFERQSYSNVFECSGQNSGFALAASALRPRGKLILLSRPDTRQSGMDLRFIVEREAELVGVSAGPIEGAVEYLARKTLDVLPLIASRHPLSEGVGATQTALRRGSLKVILENDPPTSRRFR
jgi:threonine dehydrogenase-like Zn-dependent dehydrogenase